MVSRTFNIDGYNKKYAVVVGISRYQGGFTNLQQSAQNAVRMKDFLINEAGFDYVHLITDENATLNRLKSVLQAEMPKVVGKNDQFILYWSGHGVTSNEGGKPKGYLPLANSKKSDLFTQLSINELARMDRRLRAKQTLSLIDADLDGFTGSARTQEFKQNLKQTAAPSRQMLSAGYSAKNGSSSSKPRDNTFTNAIISGLRGFADNSTGDSRKDGIITSIELEAYVRHHMNKKGSQLSRPSLNNLSNQSGNFFFVNWRHFRRAVPAMMVKPAIKPSKMAEFPWPPPKASGLQVLTADFLSEDISLYEASSRIAKALTNAGQFERRYYSVPNGFAIVTRLELITKDGDTITKLNNDKIDFLQYIKGLFWKDSKGGNFRMVVFIVTDQGFGTTGDALTRPSANKLFQAGFNSLPASYRDHKLTKNHKMTALIYEFTKPPKSKKATVIIPGNLTVKTHLTKTGWYKAAEDLSK
jgi:hypothetical protein